MHTKSTLRIITIGYVRSGKVTQLVSPAPLGSREGTHSIAFQVRPMASCSRGSSIFHVLQAACRDRGTPCGTSNHRHRNIPSGLHLALGISCRCHHPRHFLSCQGLVRINLLRQECLPTFFLCPQTPLPLSLRFPSCYLSYHLCFFLSASLIQFHRDLRLYHLSPISLPSWHHRLHLKSQRDLERSMHFCDSVDQSYCQSQSRVHLCSSL